MSAPPAEPDLPALLRSIRDRLTTFSKRVVLREVGTVLSVGSGVAAVSGLRQVRTDEIVAFPTGVQGLVLNLDHGEVDVILLGSEQGIRGGDMVVAAGERLRVPVGTTLLGRVVNPLGAQLDEGAPIDPAEHRLLERSAPGIVDRAPINQPLYTGCKLIDALIPIGRGQRELIVGDRKTGKTTLAIDAILAQRETDVACVYVAVGQRKSSIVETIDILRRTGALRYTTVVASSPDDPPALRYLAPYAGCVMAEYLMHAGRDVLIIYDDLSKHADAYRELSLLLRRPPGREAYPGDIFYQHARLLERACKLNDASGGASLTALPIIEIQRGNLSSYISTNLISITDGQIVLDSAMFNRGIKPAIDAGRSVSRVGGSAQTRAMRSVAGQLRLDLAQFEEVAHFTRFGTDVDDATRRQIERGTRLRAVLTQPAHQPRALSEQIVALYPAANGLLDALPVDRIPQFEHALIRHLEASYAHVLREIDLNGELTSDLESDLQEAIAHVTQTIGESDRSHS
ncbi:MAG: F0F1 ATP synthase subunit alpha [Chloroflexi bacterium]|nr:F0F1 ATP synthase subunit alpha [Chloroflexota bacterium]